MAELPLRKIAETERTITLGWEPPAGVEWYLAFAAGERVTNGPPTLSDGAPRRQIRFDKTRSPFEVVAIVRHEGIVAVLTGAYELPPPALPQHRRTGRFVVV